MKREELFYCYSMKLFKQLAINDIIPMGGSINQNTNAKYFVYERTPEFYKVLEEYTNSKK